MYTFSNLVDSMSTLPTVSLHLALDILINRVSHSKIVTMYRNSKTIEYGIYVLIPPTADALEECRVDRSDYL